MLSMKQPTWVSPTGRTVMYKDASGNTTYEFPDEPHPQLPYEDSSNKVVLGGFKGMVEAAHAATDTPDLAPADYDTEAVPA